MLNWDTLYTAYAWSIFALHLAAYLPYFIVLGNLSRHTPNQTALELQLAHYVRPAAL
jgi:hypothetical protein